MKGVGLLKLLRLDAKTLINHLPTMLSILGLKSGILGAQTIELAAFRHTHNNCRTTLLPSTTF
eukprot:m.17575 g.17575  ORF g.17575 m.17575 type:complete len:63 (-) comp3255_c0_seq2:113-301(-)